MQASPQNITETNGGRERRERPRHVPSSVSYVSVDNANGGVIVDISEMGMAISSAEPITHGASHILRFQLPRIDRTFETPGSLVWTSDTKRSAGVRFDSLAVEDRMQIRNWLKEELFAEAFPGRAAARRKLVFSYATLGDTTASSASSTPLLNVASGSSVVAATSASGREVTPLVPKKELPDLESSVTTDRSSEFDKLFPSERALGVELQPRPGKFARLTESTSAANIDTTALWMNFPSEAELAGRGATIANGAAAVVSAPEVEEPPTVETAAVEHVEVARSAAPEVEAVQAGTSEEMAVAATTESASVEVASTDVAEVIAEPVQMERAETVESSAVEIADEVTLPSVEASSPPADLSDPMAAATAELEEAERVEESVVNSEAVAAQMEQDASAPPEVALAEIASAPVEVAARPMEFEVAPPQESFDATEIHESPAEEIIEEPAAAVEEPAPIAHALQDATVEAAPPEAPIVSAPEPVAAKQATQIEVPAELLAPPLVFASAPPIAEELHDEPVHELNPEPQGPEAAANRLDLLDISQAVRTPGKYSSANPVSDASLESLLAIAEEEDSAVRRSQALKVVPDRKREPLPTPADEILAQIANESPDEPLALPLAPGPPATTSTISADAKRTTSATAEPVAAAAKPIRRVTPSATVSAQARPVAPIASANALPHVALRSASQQTIQHDALLGDGDKKYRGLLIIAIVVLLAGCFAVGYSRHLGIDWPWNSPATPKPENPATPKTPAANVPSTPDPSATAPAIRTPTTITSPNTKSGTAPLPDASNVQPDAQFEASAPPTAQPAAPSFFPVTAPSEGEAPRMMALPEETVFDSPRVAIRLRQDFFVPPQPGPEWKHSLERIQIGEATLKTPPPPASQTDAGTVHVRATVGTDGVVKNVRPIDGPVALIPRSMDAIRKWRYQPSLLEGQPLEWQGDFSIEFRPAR